MILIGGIDERLGEAVAQSQAEGGLSAGRGGDMIQLAAAQDYIIMKKALAPVDAAAADDQSRRIRAADRRFRSLSRPGEADSCQQSQ